MQTTNVSMFTVTARVYDLLYIQVNDSNFNTGFVSYTLIDRTDKVVRKGSFKAPVVQLNLTGLAEGHYNLKLEISNNDFHEYIVDKVKPISW